MLITVRHGGGFAGIEEASTTDTAGLDAARVALIRQRLDALERFVSREPQPVGADLPRYDIEVTGDDGRVRTTTVLTEGDPGTLPRPLADLLDAL